MLTAPVWLAQGLHLALTAPRLPEAAGPRQGRVGAGRLRLLILGDSSAAGVGAATQDQALAGRLAAALADLEPDWRLVARTGATTAAALALLRSRNHTPTDAAVVALGVNDLTRGVALPRWLAAQRALVAHLTGDLGARRVYLTGVPPMGAFPALPQPLRGVLGARAARFDAALAGLVATLPAARHLPFDPGLTDPALMASDGYHPGPALYTLWAEALARAIRADLPPQGAAP